MSLWEVTGIYLVVFFLPTTRGHQERVPPIIQNMGLLSRTLILDIPISKAVRNTFLFFINYPAPRISSQWTKWSSLSNHYMVFQKVPYWSNAIGVGEAGCVVAVRGPWLPCEQEPYCSQNVSPSVRLPTSRHHHHLPVQELPSWGCNHMVQKLFSKAGCLTLISVPSQLQPKTISSELDK